MSRLSAWVRAVIGRESARHRPLSAPLVQDGFPVACCWSPKAGCTTVLKWFLKHTGKLEEALEYSSWLHDYRIEQLFQQPDYHELCKRMVRSDAVRVIKVIRDPAQRAVSSYLHYLRWMGTEWLGARLLAAWKAANGCGAQEGVSFIQFLEFVIDHQRHDRPLEPHVRPQYDADWDRHVDAYIPLEDLEAGLAETERLCGLPHVAIRPLSESMHHNTPSLQHWWPHKACRLLATSETLEQLGTPPARVLLDDITRPLVHAAYERDYVAYARFYPRTS